MGPYWWLNGGVPEPWEWPLGPRERGPAQGHSVQPQPGGAEPRPPAAHPAGCLGVLSGVCKGGPAVLAQKSAGSVQGPWSGLQWGTSAHCTYSAKALLPPGLPADPALHPDLCSGGCGEAHHPGRPEPAAAAVWPAWLRVSLPHPREPGPSHRLAFQQLQPAVPELLGEADPGAQQEPGAGEPPSATRSSFCP